MTLPGLVLGTGSIAAAFGVGLFDHSDKPACRPERVPAPARSSFQLAVANAGETSGEATSVGRELTKRGFAVAKLNVGALGNVTPQLHVHVVGRRPGDAAWPGPVWGVGVAEPLTAEALERPRRPRRPRSGSSPAAW